MTTAMTATAWRFSAVVFFVMVTMVTTAAAAKEWEVKEIKFGEEKKKHDYWITKYSILL